MPYLPNSSFNSGYKFPSRVSLALAISTNISQDSISNYIVILLYKYLKKMGSIVFHLLKVKAVENKFSKEILKFEIFPNL